MITIQRCKLVLVVALLVPYAAWVDAADRCRPVLLLAAGRAMTVHADDAGPPVWLEARLTKPVEVPKLGSELGLPVGERLELKRDLARRDLSLGRGVIDGDQATLHAAESSDPVLLRADDRSVLATVVDYVARDVAGQPLKVGPNLEGTNVFVEVAAGAEVRALEGGRAVIQPGAVLRWRALPGEPLRMYLNQPVRMPETAATHSGHLGGVKPAFAPPNGKVHVTLDAPGLDLRVNAPAFCIYVQGNSVSSPTRLVSQEGDKATFELRIPPGAADLARQGLGAWDRISGAPAKLRAVAYVNQQPALDQWIDIRVSSIAWAIGMGLALLVVLYSLCAWATGHASPIAIGGRLIQQPNGRYSLSNLQVLMWSLLVLFSLTFAWVTTGELLLLSNDVLKMLGIVGGSSVLARALERMRPPETPRAEPDKKDLVADPDGKFDLLRFQMLAFTLFSLVYSLASVLRSDGLPELPESLYWLMGISNSTYVAGKIPAVVSKGSASEVPSDGGTPPEVATAKARVLQLQSRLNVTPTGLVDPRTQEAIRHYQAKNGLYPINGRVTEPLLLHLGV